MLLIIQAEFFWQVSIFVALSFRLSIYAKMELPTVEQQTPKEIVALPWKKGPTSFEIWHEAEETPDWIIGEIDPGTDTLVTGSTDDVPEPSVARSR